MAKDTKNKKENKHFFKDFKAELKKVIWPTPKQLVNNTVAVITIVLITAVIVFALDFIFEKMNTYGINKIKEAVTSSNEVNDNSISDSITDVIDDEVEQIEDETATEEERGSKEKRIGYRAQCFGIHLAGGEKRTCGKRQ